MSPKIRHTLIGFSGGAVLFLGLGIYLNRAAGFSVLEHPGPLAMLVLVGATVGALVAPLAAGLLGRGSADPSDGDDR